MKFIPLALGAVALGLACSTMAQKVYRCGPDGRTYQQTACAEGKVVDASDPRTAEQRQAAQAVAKGEAKTAAQFDSSASAAPAAKRGKTRAETESTTADKAASSANKGAKKADAEDKPLVFLVPKPKGAASAAK